MNILFVGIGGACGSILRYLLGLIPIKSPFPFMTFLINISGAILIGMLVELIPQISDSDQLLLLLKTGFCGGYTTFSTFSLEVFQLFNNKNYLTGSFYLILSITCSIIGIWCGMYFANLLTKFV